MQIVTQVSDKVWGHDGGQSHGCPWTSPNSMNEGADRTNDTIVGHLKPSRYNEYWNLQLAATIICNFAYLAQRGPLNDMQHTASDWGCLLCPSSWIINAGDHGISLKSNVFQCRYAIFSRLQFFQGYLEVYVHMYIYMYKYI